MTKIISCALSPNTEAEDVREALAALLSPSSWQEGAEVKKVETWFKETFGAGAAVSFNSGRSALLAILKAFGIGKEDEVICQAFTCVAVPNSVRWAGARPVYADIDDTFNMDPQSLEKRTTKKTKAIIVQHTFGIAADLDALAKIAKRHHIILIEDCAHGLGGYFQGRRLGTFGDAAFFSFGRDKVISSVWGGMALINDKPACRTGRCQMTNAKWKLQEIQKKLAYPSHYWILQQLLHPVAFSLILPLYQSGFGKALLIGLQKTKLLSVPVYPEEKRGDKPDIFPAKYPNALARLLLLQLSKLDRFIRNRQEIAALYAQALKDTPGITVVPEITDSSWLRYPILVEDSHELRLRARRRGVYLGNWYHNVIDPAGVDFQTVCYAKGSCPHAEYVAKHILNLPTRISLDDAKRVIEATEFKA